MALNLRKKKIGISSGDESSSETNVVPLFDSETSTSDVSTNEQLEMPQAQSPVSSQISKIEKRLKVYSKVNDLYQETNLNQTALMGKILDLVLKAVEAQGGSLWLLADDGSSLVCQVATGPDAKEIIGQTLPKNKGVVGWVGQFAKPCIQNNISKEKRLGSSSPDLSTSGTTSVLACPLKYKTELVGVIELVDKAEGHPEFDETDLEFLEDISTPVGMYIKTALTQKRQNELLKKLQVFKGVQDTLGSTMDLNPLLNLVVNKAIELLNAEVGSIWLMENNNEGIECAYAEGPTKDQVVGVKVKKGVGIIGWVVDNQKPSIVADCSKDVRFSSALDKKIGFVTQSMISAPLVVKGECLGAIQILNKKGQGLLFNQEDLDFLSLFAGTAAMYVKNAKLFASEKKAKELSALISISKEISSTLDIDAVLMSVVNLSSDIIPYKKACISTFHHGLRKFSVKAINGHEKINQQDSDVQSIEVLHNFVVQNKKEIVLNSREELVNHPAEIQKYLDGKDIQSLWVIVLKDDQGEIGVLSMEAAEKQLVRDNLKELLSLLVSQVTVALRNAELYTTIPSSKVLSTLKDQIFASLSQIMTWPRERIYKAVAGIAVVVASLIFIRVPYHVETNIEVVPILFTHYAEARSRIGKILVMEGERVEEGQLLALLDVSDLRISRHEKESQRQKLKAEMIKLMMDDKTAEFQMKEKEMLSLELEVQRLDHQLRSGEIRAAFPGVVVSDHLQELVGKPVDYGQEVIKIARDDKVFVQFEVPEEEVTHVAPDLEVKFKVFGFPHVTFQDDIHLQSVAGEGKPLNEQDKAKFFIARAEVDNSQSNEMRLRPGMTGRGKIKGPQESLGYILFNKPLRFVMNKLVF